MLGVGRDFPSSSGWSASAFLCHVLVNAWKPSTRQSYALKWSRFSGWAQVKSVVPETFRFSVLLYQLSGLSNSSIKVHFAAISTFHKVQGRSFFFASLQSIFERSAKCLSLSSNSPCLLLLALTASPFELEYCLCILSIIQDGIPHSSHVTSLCWKIICSLCGLSFKFHATGASLRPWAKFLPKVLSPFHLSQKIFLLIFIPPR